MLAKTNGYDRLRVERVYMELANSQLQAEKFADSNATYALVVKGAGATANEKANAHLWMGRMADTRKDRAEAQRHYNAVLELDCAPNLKADARALLDRFSTVKPQDARVPKWVKAKPKGRARHDTPVLLLSDLHLDEVVDRDSELVRPVAVTIANQQVAVLVFTRHLDAEAEPVRFGQTAVPARARVTFTANVPARARARVDVMPVAQTGERVLVHLRVVALAQNGIPALVCPEPKPVQILEQSPLEGRPAPDAIVVLDAQDHAPAEGARESPDVDRVHDVSQVQVPCR